MDKTLLVLLCLLAFSSAPGQDATSLYEQGLELAKEEKLAEAIGLFSRSIALEPEANPAWFYRGIARYMQKEYEEASADLDQAIKHFPHFQNAYVSRGLAKRRLTEYEDAISDFSFALFLDPDYGEAYYYRGQIYDLLRKTDSACADFSKAEELAIKSAQYRVERCNDTGRSKKELYPILRLSKKATNPKYGFTEKHPVKVGSGPEGGPGNQQAYLELLRDAQGKPLLNYERVGSCCTYETENGILGLGKLDKYEITYLDKKGKQKTTIVYITFYDYEEPQILHGFQTVRKK